MDTERFAGSLFDWTRLGYVLVVSALFIIVDIAFLDFVGIESAAGAILQFLTIAFGAYAGLTIVDVAFDMEEE